MYSSNSNNLIISSYPKPFSFESNQTSSKDIETNSPFPLPPPPPPTPLSFFPFPCSLFEDNQIFIEHQHDFLLHHHQSPPAEPVVVNTTEPNSNSINTKINIPPPPPLPPAGKPMEQQIPRKRSSKRDRHSKINTAKGLRDRRMRLSLEVAKRFFGLQDMLGFEKASKTVEWLLNQAKAEIKQLAREKSVGAKSASSTSECEEGVSSLDEVVVSGNQQQERETHKVVKRRNNKVSRKSAFNPIGREKARERARERTREKMKTKRLASTVGESNSTQCNNNGKNHNNNLLSSCWNPFESTVEEESAGTKHQSQSVVNPSFDVQLVEAEEPSSHAKEHSGTVVEDNSLFNIMMFSSLNNSGILQEHQFEQFESMEKPWEAYNNRI